MRKGQGSLEYLLILAAILAIAVVVVVVANSLMSAPRETAALEEDKYKCGLQGIVLEDYTEVGTVTGVTYNGNPCTPVTSITGADAKCTLGDGTTLEVKKTGSTTCEYSD
ncbi:MAG: class III signal peptide-containing protein [Candidatus Diapherotrites archaeon]|nr:class III signal peptide-containing protein [Candidatus Diapherotrites archaeon]